MYFFPSSTKRRLLAGIISASYVTGSDLIYRPENRKILGDVFMVFLGGRKLIVLKLGTTSLHILSNSLFTNYRILRFTFLALRCNNQ